MYCYVCLFISVSFSSRSRGKAASREAALESVPDRRALKNLESEPLVERSNRFVVAEELEAVKQQKGKDHIRLLSKF